MSVESRRALCIGVGSFVAAGTEDGDELDLLPFGELGYAGEYAGELHAALRAAGYDAELVVEPDALGADQPGERVERHLARGGVAVVHVLSHGEHTPDGGVYVVGSDAARSKLRGRTAAGRPLVGPPRTEPDDELMPHDHDLRLESRLHHCPAGEVNETTRPSTQPSDVGND